MSKKLNKIIAVSIILVIIFMSIGYSALNKNLNISGELTYRPDEQIRVTSFVPKGSASNMTIQYYEFSKKEVRLGCTPSATTATASYDVTVQNKSSYTYVISEITKTGDNNLTYELSNYKVGQGIGKNSSITFTITFKYNVNSLPQNRAQAVSLNFTFVRPYAEIVKYNNTQSQSKCTNVQCALDDLYDKLR